MSRIDEDTVVHLLKDSVGEAPYPPDRFDRIVAKAGRQRHQRATRVLGPLCVALAVLGSVVALDRRERTWGDPIAVVTAASDTAVDLGSSRFEGRMQFSLGAEEFSVVIAGAMDFRRGRSDISVLSELPGAPTARQRIIQVGKTLYASIPDHETRAIAAGKRWIATPGSLTTAADVATEFDPRSMLDALKDGAKSIDEVGRETVRGTRTTRYHVVNEPPRADSPFAALAAVSPEMDIWIDRDGLPRRMKLVIDVGPLVASYEGSTEVPVEPTKQGSTYTLEFFDYGKPVTIDAPPAAEVVGPQDPLLTGFGADLGCISEKMAAVGEEIKARVAKGEPIDQAEMQRLFAEANASCRSQDG